jgi:hypothetical protein
MAKERITLTRGLVQLKLLDKRIKKAIHMPFITYKIGTVVQLDCSPEDSMKSVKDLIERRADIKAAIMAANAATIVTIGKEEMTITAAIERKKTIVYLEELRSSLSKQYYNVAGKIESENNEMQYRLDRLLEANAGKDLKARDTEIDTITKAYKVSNEAILVDPINIEQTIKELDESIDTFLAEVDLCLSEINAVTHIEI